MRAEPLPAPSAAPPEDCGEGCPPQFGHAHARIYTPPLGPLTPQTTGGYKAIRLAEILGLGLLPWQKWALLHMLEYAPGQPGVFRFQQVVLLVSRQAGKTTLAVLLMLYWLVALKRKLVVNAAQDLATAEEAWDSVIEMFRTNPVLAGQMVQEPVMAAGKKALILVNPARRAIPKASNRKAGRGLSIDDLFLDEVREQRTFEAYDALSSATIARPNAQILLASNAGDIESIVLAHLRDQALADIKDGTESGIGILEYSAAPEWDPGAVESWRWSCPGLGRTILVPALRSKYAAMPITSWRTEFLTQFVARMDSPVDLTAWESTSDPQGNAGHVFRRGELHMAVEVSHDAQHVSLLAGGMDRADSIRPRVRLQVVKSWAGTGCVTQCERELKGIVDKARPRDLVWFPGGPGAVLRAVVKKIRSTRIVEYRGSAVSGACMAFSEQVSARNVLHSGEALMSTQIAAAKRTPMGDGWRFDVKGIGAHVDALYAASAVVEQSRLEPPRINMAVMGKDPS